MWTTCKASAKVDLPLVPCLGMLAKFMLQKVETSGRKVELLAFPMKKQGVIRLTTDMNFAFGPLKLPFRNYSDPVQIIFSIYKKKTFTRKTPSAIPIQAVLPAQSSNMPKRQNYIDINIYWQLKERVDSSWSSNVSDLVTKFSEAVQ